MAASGDPIEGQLRSLTQVLDNELAGFAARDEEAAKRIAALAAPTWPDELDRLLGRVNQQSGLLLHLRLRSSRPSASHAVLSTRTEVYRLGQEWSDAPLDGSLPSVCEREGISLKIEAIKVSSHGILFAFQLKSAVPFGSAATTSADALALTPTLTGVRAYDDLDTLYAIQPAKAAQLHTFEYTSTLEFSPAPPSGPVSLGLRIASVLVTVQQPYVATAAEARLITGPWEFTFHLSDFRTPR